VVRWKYSNNKLFNKKDFSILVTLIHADPGINGKCPDNAQNIGGLCRCNIGYRVTEGNRNCGKIIHNCLLIE